MKYENPFNTAESSQRSNTLEFKNHLTFVYRRMLFLNVTMRLKALFFGVSF